MRLQTFPYHIYSLDNPFMLKNSVNLKNKQNNTIGKHKGSLDLDLANKCLGEVQLIEVEERSKCWGTAKHILGKTSIGQHLQP